MISARSGIVAICSLLATACGQAPLGAATDLVADDPALAAAVREAAAVWAEAGLEIASFVTVNQDDGGVPVRARPRTELIAACDFDPADVGDGCVERRRGRFLGLWIADDLAPRRVTSVLRHELIHLIVPDAVHLSARAGKVGIFTDNANRDEPTADDLAEMARHTTVIAGP